MRGLIEMGKLTTRIQDDRIIATLPRLPHIEIRPYTLSNWMDANMDTGGVPNCLYMVRNLHKCVAAYLKDNL